MGTDVRTSTYTIYITLPGGEHHYLIHGYSGAVDRVGSDVIRFLLDHEDKGQNGKTMDEHFATEHIQTTPLGTALPPDAQALLLRRGYLTDKSPNEEREFCRKMLAYSYKRRVAQARPAFMIIPTHDCNLRCWYCYEAPARSGLGTDKATILSRDMACAAFKCMDDLLKQSRATPCPEPVALKPSRLSLYGGEPLMERTATIVPYLVEQARARGFHTEAITNGVELHRFAQVLGPHGLQEIQVTLDGPREIHDHVRSSPSYPYTYDAILDNVALALDLGVKVNLRVHADRDNIAYIQQIAEDLDRRGLRANEKLHGYLIGRHLWHLGHAVPRPPQMSFAEIEEALAQCPPESGIPAYFKSRNLLITRKLNTYIKYGVEALLLDVVGCTANTSLYIFDPAGAVYPCFNVCGNPREQIGTYSAEGLVLNERAHVWWSRSLSDIPECVDCKYVLFDRGGCPDAANEFNHSPASNFCGSYENDFLLITRELCRRGRIEEMFASTQNQVTPAQCAV